MRAISDSERASTGDIGPAVRCTCLRRPVPFSVTGRQTEPMSQTLTAELASLSIASDTLRDRVGALTGNLSGANHEHIVLVLYEVERALLSASRQLARAERLSRTVR